MFLAERPAPTSRQVSGGDRQFKIYQTRDNRFARGAITQSSLVGAYSGPGSSVYRHMVPSRSLRLHERLLSSGRRCESGRQGASDASGNACWDLTNNSA